jgi:hypothetical protein
VPFPNLTLRPDQNSPGGVSTSYAQATGIPDNGNNAFNVPFLAAGVDPNLLDEDWFEVTVVLNGQQGLAAGVTGVTFVSWGADRETLTLNFTQTAPGVGQALVIVRLIHTIERGA